MNAPEDQLALCFDPKHAPNLRADVARLKSYLAGRGFVLGKALEAALGWDARYLRGVASASRGHIASGPGKAGYGLTACPSVRPDEVRGIICRLRSQRAQMASREAELAAVLALRPDS